MNKIKSAILFSYSLNLYERFYPVHKFDKIAFAQGKSSPQNNPYWSFSIR